MKKDENDVPKGLIPKITWVKSHMAKQLYRCFMNGLGQGTSMAVVLYIVYKLDEMHIYQLLEHIVRIFGG